MHKLVQLSENSRQHEMEPTHLDCSQQVSDAIFSLTPSYKHLRYSCCNNQWPSFPRRQKADEISLNLADCVPKQTISIWRSDLERG